MDRNTAATLGALLFTIGVLVAFAFWRSDRWILWSRSCWRRSVWPFSRSGHPQICSLVTMNAAPRAAPIHPAITPPRDVHTWRPPPACREIGMVGSHGALKRSTPCMQAGITD